MACPQRHVTPLAQTGQRSNPIRARALGSVCWLPALGLGGSLENSFSFSFCWQTWNLLPPPSSSTRPIGGVPFYPFIDRDLINSIFEHWSAHSSIHLFAHPFNSLTRSAPSRAERMRWIALDRCPQWCSRQQRATLRGHYATCYYGAALRNDGPSLFSGVVESDGRVGMEKMERLVAAGWGFFFPSAALAGFTCSSSKKAKQFFSGQRPSGPPPVCARALLLSVAPLPSRVFWNLPLSRALATAFDPYSTGRRFGAIHRTSGYGPSTWAWAGGRRCGCPLPRRLAQRLMGPTGRPGRASPNAE